MAEQLHWIDMRQESAVRLFHADVVKYQFDDIPAHNRQRF